MINWCLKGLVVFNKNALLFVLFLEVQSWPDKQFWSKTNFQLLCTTWRRWIPPFGSWLITTQRHPNTVEFLIKAPMCKVETSPNSSFADTLNNPPPLKMILATLSLLLTAGNSARETSGVILIMVSLKFLCPRFSCSCQPVERRTLFLSVFFASNL